MNKSSSHLTKINEALQQTLQIIAYRDKLAYDVFNNNYSKCKR